MFCLQCGQAEPKSAENTAEILKSEETTDPVLKRALLDATDGEIVFNVAVNEAVAVESKPVKSSGHKFLSLRAVMAPPHPMATSGAFLMPPPASVPTLEPSVAGEKLSGTRKSASVMPAASTLARTIGSSMVKAWVIGFVGLGLFVGVNIGMSSYYSNRVYPGVHIGNLAVGGWTFDELHQKMPQVLPSPMLTAVVGSSRIDLGLRGEALDSSADLERKIRESGRTTALPIAGVIGSLLAKPVAPTFALTDDAVDRSVQRLATAVERSASNAVATIHGTDVFVLAEKPGVRIDKVAAAAAVRAAYGHVATASISPIRVEPNVGAADFANDVSLAQATITTVVQVTVNKAHYSPSTSQIASWLVFNGPGKGMNVDSAGVAVFVATIPGSFDRNGTVNGVVAALNARQGATLTPSVKKPTAGPKLASIMPVGPIATYDYCVGEADGAAADFDSTVATVLGTGGSWTLGGKLKFVPAKTGCNFTVRLANTSVMAALDPACEHQTTCRIHNDLAIAKDSWAKAPAARVGDAKTYHVELINHVVGQWLGFEHPSCSTKTAQVQAISAPSIQIAGCSPKWYAVPAELQDTKVLPGF